MCSAPLAVVHHQNYEQSVGLTRAVHRVVLGTANYPVLSAQLVTTSTLYNPHTVVFLSSVLCTTVGSILCLCHMYSVMLSAVLCIAEGCVMYNHPLHTTALYNLAAQCVTCVTPPLYSTTNPHYSSTDCNTPVQTVLNHTAVHYGAGSVLYQCSVVRRRHCISCILNFLYHSIPKLVSRLLLKELPVV